VEFRRYKTEITFGVHWLSFTVHAPREDAFIIYDILFKRIFGDLEDLGHGGRGFKEIFHALIEFKIYLTPAYETDDEYFHFEIPGKACELLSWEYYQGLESLISSCYSNRYSYKRIDLAFDNCPFTPMQVEEAIREGKVRSLAKRESLEMHNSPFLLKENGKEGTHTVYFGSRSSERMIRVYDKRGFTRLELELKDERADLVAKELFQANDISKWYTIMIGHLRDFVDFENPWWSEFVSGKGRAWAVISNPKDIEMEKILNWIDRQVTPALSVVIDTQPEEVMEILLKKGRERRGSKYNLLLNKKEMIK
jgi:DNA relaxase NicK